MAIRRIPVLIALILIGVGVDSAVGALPTTSPWPVDVTFVLGLLLLVSYVTGALAADLGLPRITGYILAGLLIGPSGVGVVTDADVASLTLIDQLAIALIAFSAGAELKLREVKAAGKVIAAILTSEMVMVFVAVAGVVLLLKPIFPITAGRGWDEAIIIASVFGSIAIANSPSVAVAVINDTRSRGPVSSTILGVTVLKDVAVIVLFAVMLSLARTFLDGGGEGGGLGLELVERMWWEIGGSIMVGALIGWLVSMYLGKWRREPILFVLGVAALVAVIADQLHLEILLTALTTGFFVENIAETEAEPFVKAVEANALPFYALFFSLAGATIHLDELAEVGLLVLLLVAVRAAAIWLGTNVGARVGGASDKVRRYTWTGFVSQAGVTLGMVTIAAEAFPEWGAEMRTLFVAMVAIHELGGPVLLQKGLAAAGETGARDREGDADDGADTPAPVATG
ncbi:cation:proton antiporter [Gaopeijia maritima]|uniref:Cation:proton antiporter n=1 Tax=Gaopeijia maritima TaxID=3119007 RepID=A0ABU9E4Q1_9BACT